MGRVQSKALLPREGRSDAEISKRVLFRALLKGGMSKAAIGRDLGISRRTATRWAAADGAGRGSEALTYGPRAALPSVLDPYKEIVRLRLSEYPDLSSERLFRELRGSGYQGGYDVVKRYVRQVRPQPGKEPVVRFETVPGRQGQVDFAEFRLPWGKRYALLVVLGYSPWFQFYGRQTMEVLMRGLEAAFAYFGGVPWELLFDQLKAVEDRRASAGELLRNAEFSRFSRHCDFVIRACRPYRAQTKGKVERPVRYIRDGFFYGREFVSDEDLTALLETGRGPRDVEGSPVGSLSVFCWGRWRRDRFGRGVGVFSGEGVLSPPRVVGSAGVWRSMGGRGQG